MTPTDLGPAGRLQSFCHLPIPDVSFHGEFGRVTDQPLVLRLFPKIAKKNDEPALVSAVGGAGSAMLFSVAAAI